MARGGARAHWAREGARSGMRGGDAFVAPAGAVLAVLILSLAAGLCFAGPAAAKSYSHRRRADRRRGQAERRPAGRRAAHLLVRGQLPLRLLGHLDPGQRGHQGARAWTGRTERSSDPVAPRKRATPSPPRGESVRVTAFWPMSASDTFTLRYRALGAATRYEDTGELYWQFIGDGWGAQTAQGGHRRHPAERREEGAGARLGPRSAERIGQDPARRISLLLGAGRPAEDVRRGPHPVPGGGPLDGARRPQRRTAVGARGGEALGRRGQRPAPPRDRRARGGHAGPVQLARGRRGRAGAPRARPAPPDADEGARLPARRPWRDVHGHPRRVVAGAGRDALGAQGLRPHGCAGDAARPRPARSTRPRAGSAGRAGPRSGEAGVPLPPHRQARQGRCAPTSMPSSLCSSGTR